MQDGKEDLSPPVDRLIANFMTNASPIETYLHHDGPLSLLQWNLLQTTFVSLQIFLNDWVERNGRPKQKP